MSRFTCYLPPGWVRFDLGPGSTPDVRPYALVATSGAPAVRRAPLAHEVERGVRGVLEDLASGGAWAAVLPVTAGAAPLVSAMAVFMPLATVGVDKPLDLLLALASTDPTARVIDVEGLVALRTSTSVRDPEYFAAAASQARMVLAVDRADAPDDAVVEAQHRRIRYLVGDPLSEDRWADVLFSVTSPDTGEGQELADAAVDLFDAVMTTFAWTEEWP